MSGFLLPVYADQSYRVNAVDQTNSNGVQGRVVAEQTSPKIEGFDDLRRIARSRADAIYRPEPPLTPALANLDYEQYREITFRHEKGVWTNSGRPFWLEFFHRGFVQQDRVDVFTIGSGVEPIRYDKSLFRFGDVIEAETIPNNVGFAGFKIAGRFTPAGDPQELLSFIGSSYFRARSGDTVYGSSARGLAINIGMPRKEEFPDFREFWIVDPAPNDTTITVLAFLDSPSLTGAYQFVLNPGADVSTVDVRSELYLRQHGSAPEIDKLAIAPLTSMWMWGDGLDGPPKDLRPSVHDCDGLLVHADGKPTWRAIARLPYPSVARIDMASLEGFGLMQRQRSFDRYRDTNARYHERPSVWIQPGEHWPDGALELIELPGAHEGIDNIGAYWVSKRHPTKDEPLLLSYQVRFGSDIALPCVQASSEKRSDDEASESVYGSLGICDEFQVAWTGKQIELQVHFAMTSVVGSGLADLDLPGMAIQTIRATVVHQKIDRVDNGYRVAITLEPDQSLPPELTLALKDQDGELITETFKYLCPLEEPQFVYPDVYTRIESAMASGN